jgi:hypothetical protein
MTLALDHRALTTQHDCIAVDENTNRSRVSIAVTVAVTAMTVTSFECGTATATFALFITTASTSRMSAFLIILV